MWPPCKPSNRARASLTDSSGPSYGVAVRLVVLPADQLERTLPLQLGVSLQDRGLLVVRELTPRTVEVEAVLLGQRRQELPGPSSGRDTPWQDDALQDGNALVSDRERTVRLETHSEAVAGRTGPVRRIERELPGLELWNADAALGTGVVLAEQVSLGGGIAGLATAFNLARMDFGDILILEKEMFVGSSARRRHPT